MDMDQTVYEVANLMALSARTAPKAAGQDYIEVVVLNKEQCEKLGSDMIEYGRSNKQPLFERDGKGVKASSAMLLIGLRAHQGVGLECGACGHPCKFETQMGKNFIGPNCDVRVLDLGIALGSAVKTAQIHNVDNRIMYRAGATALKQGLIQSNFVMGIPLSATGKNIFWDRQV
jgi:uncharacterized ferredoxin-like protein